MNQGAKTNPTDYLSRSPKDIVRLNGHSSLIRLLNSISVFQHNHKEDFAAIRANGRASKSSENFYSDVELMDSLISSYGVATSIAIKED